MSEIISKYLTPTTPKLLHTCALSLIITKTQIIFSIPMSAVYRFWSIFQWDLLFVPSAFIIKVFCIALYHHTVYALFPLWTLAPYPTHSLANTITKVLLACTSTILAIPHTTNTQKPGCKDLPREPILYYKLFYTALHNVFT